MQFMLCSVDFNDSVAVLTLLYLLLAHTGSLGCNYSERAPVLNLEVLPCQYLCTMLLSMFSITLTTLSSSLPSLQAPLSRTCRKFFLLSHRVPILHPSTSPSISDDQLPPSTVPQCWSPSLQREF